MMAQQELQNLLNLPDQEKLLLAHRLLESLLEKANGQPIAADVQAAADDSPDRAASDEPHPSVKWLLARAGMYSVGPSDTGERADEICAAEIKRYSGFTLKDELP